MQQKETWDMLTINKITVYVMYHGIKKIWFHKKIKYRLYIE